MALIVYKPNGPLSYNKKTRTFSGELSDLKVSPDNNMIILNPETGNSMDFKLQSKDIDGSGEDVYGYRYQSYCGLKLLLIND